MRTVKAFGKREMVHGQLTCLVDIKKLGVTRGDSQVHREIVGMIRVIEIMLGYIG